MMRTSGLMFGLVLFGLHLTLPLTLPGGRPLVPEIILFVLFGSTLHLSRALTADVVAKLAIINGIALLGFVLNFWPGWPLGGFILSALNLNFSLILTFALVRFMFDQSENADIYRRLFIFTLVILAISLSEILVPAFEVFVDFIRYSIFPEKRIYTADWRDIAVYGFARPTFFGNEPSYLGITTSTLTVMLFIMTKHTGKQVLALTLFCVGVLIVRSPTAVAIGILMPYFFLVELRNSALTKSKAFIVLFSPILAFIVIALFVDQFGERMGLFLSGGDNSGDIRLIKPIEAVYLSMSQSPIFGTGLGGREKIAADMLANSDWGSHTDYVFDRGNSLGDFFSTGTWLIFTELGLSGFFVLFLIYSMFRKLMPLITGLDFSMTFLAISITMGGWSHARVWLLIGIVLFAIQIRRSTMYRDKAPSALPVQEPLQQANSL